jgi:hypothetical protein
LIVPLKESEKKRWLYVTPEVAELLNGTLHAQTVFPSIEADLAIGRYCKGLIVSVTDKPNVAKADFKLLSNLDQAWVMYFPGPGAGWRLFGRFARNNHFVGLSCYAREECAPKSVYDLRARDMIADWESRFVAPPLKASEWSDYVGGYIREKDS